MKKEKKPTREEEKNKLLNSPHSRPILTKPEVEKLRAAAAARSTNTKPRPSQSVNTSTRAKTQLKELGYTFLNYLGSGTYAKVYLATFQPPGKPISDEVKLAVKCMETKGHDEVFRNRFFYQEIKILRHLNHRSIVGVHSVFQQSSKLFIFMEYCGNGDILQHINARGPYTEARLKQVTRQLLEGLAYLHNLKISHRDIKCENLFLDGDHNLKIGDFGFARHFDIKRQPLSKSFCGTAPYAAPEIIRGEPYNPLMCDVWSGGISCYVMATRDFPFSTTNGKGLLKEQMARDWHFDGPSRLLSPECKRVITQMLEPIHYRRKTAAQLLGFNWFAGGPEYHGQHIGVQTIEEEFPESNSDHQNKGSDADEFLQGGDPVEAQAPVQAILVKGNEDFMNLARALGVIQEEPIDQNEGAPRTNHDEPGPSKQGQLRTSNDNGKTTNSGETILGYTHHPFFIHNQSMDSASNSVRSSITQPNSSRRSSMDSGSNSLRNSITYYPNSSKKNSMDSGSSSAQGSITKPNSSKKK